MADVEKLNLLNPHWRLDGSRIGDQRGLNALEHQA